MRNERRRSRLTMLAFSCFLLAVCPGGFQYSAQSAKTDEATKTPAFGITFTVPAADYGGPLRELEEVPLGLGMTLGETRIRLPELTRDQSLEFAAPPTYYVCDEITATHNYILSGPRRAAALRGLYAEKIIRSVPYVEFVARAQKRYGGFARSES